MSKTMKNVNTFCLSNVIVHLSIVCLLWQCNSKAVTYVVHMDESYMPRVFTSQRHWYSSTVTSLDSATEHVNSSILYSYENALHGFSAALSPQQLQSLKETPGFISAYRDRAATLDTTASYTFLSLNVSHGLWPASNYGQNVVVGVVDSGIWPESDSFKDDGMVTQTPPKWKGKCQGGQRFDPSLCNSKLIGARYFNKGLLAAHDGDDDDTKIGSNSVRDSMGHGTHTASTVAGNYVRGASYFGYAKGTARGIAPRAKIAMYKVSWAQGAFASDMLAGLDQAIADGVDVISISMGLDMVPLYEDPVAIAAFSALEKGIVVSASAGNAGPSLGSIHNGIPWVLTVGASNTERSFGGTLILGDGKRFSGWTLFPASATVNNLPLVYHNNASACDSSTLLSQVARGSVVICDSVMDVNQQIQQVSLSAVYGAVFISSDPTLFETGKMTFPGLVISPHHGKNVIEYARATQPASATIKFQETFVGTKRAPTVASYSSRGPSWECPWVLKPDIMAPGSSILAAWVPDLPAAQIGPNVVLNNEYNLLSGTSMACPHASGVVALLRSAHPEWSASAVRSALITTASPLDNSGKPIEENGELSPRASPLAMGAGLIDPNRALDPGLVYDTTPQDYVNLLCAMNFTQAQILAITRSKAYNCSSPSYDVNYPSFVAFSADQSVTVERKFRRSVTYVGDGPAAYTARVSSSNGTQISVSPNRLVFKAKYEKRKFSLTLKSEMKKENAVAFGSLEWVEETGTHVVRSPLVVVPTNFVFNP
ncbi:Peptidase S8 [Vigna unguiculata]|uniref:Peptidase S8 n=1 Tax=Vigna unguiculata TaxID=3917 RepID=A0A4D6KLR0_VIGUN|nr:Peptidase S8 [Vigna unguiculata]